MIVICSMLFILGITIYELVYVAKNLDIMMPKKSHIEKREEVLKFIILLPVLSEKEQVQDAIEYFVNLNYKEKQIVIITTEKELQFVEYADSVCKLAVELEDKYINVRRIHYPETQGTKASQLNYAIKVLELEASGNNTFLIVYDVDSRPDKMTLHEINEIYIRNPSINVFQQSCTYTRNFDSLNYWFRTEAIFQTRRSFGIEIPNYRFTKYYKGHPYLMPYCVGHGLVVRLNFLIRIGGFPEPYEDIAFGARMVLMKQYICPLESTFDKADVVDNFSRYIRQMGVWYLATWAGLVEIFKDRSACLLYKTRVIVWSILDVLSWDFYLLYCILLGSCNDRCIMLIGAISILLISGFNLFIALKHMPAIMQMENSNERNIDKTIYVMLSLPRELLRGLAPLSAVWLLGCNINRTVNKKRKRRAITSE